LFCAFPPATQTNHCYQFSLLFPSSPFISLAKKRKPLLPLHFVLQSSLSYINGKGDPEDKKRKKEREKNMTCLKKTNTAPSHSYLESKKLSSQKQRLEFTRSWKGGGRNN
jgi:hypothetical protein